MLMAQITHWLTFLFAMFTSDLCFARNIAADSSLFLTRLCSKVSPVTGWAVLTAQPLFINLAAIEFSSRGADVLM